MNERTRRIKLFQMLSLAVVDVMRNDGELPQEYASIHHLVKSYAKEVLPDLDDIEIDEMLGLTLRDIAFSSDR